MDRARAIELLNAHGGELRAAGVRRLYLFGSTARDAAGDASDVDLYVDLAPGQRFSLFDMMDLRERVSSILGARADVFTRRGLHRALRPAIQREAIRIF
jgi:predicted nucleotidyltransferase